MSNISYSAQSGSAKYRSNALTMFKNLQENVLEESNLNILTESGVSDLCSNEVVFADFKQNLLENMESDEERARMSVLMENTRAVMLSESFLSGSNPITALSLPMLRVGWPKIAVREGLPTEPVEQPSFKVTIKRPYILDKNNVKRYLPEALLGDDAVEHTLPRLETGKINAVNGVINNYDLLGAVGKSPLLGDEIDPKFSLTSVEVTFPNGGAQTIQIPVGTGQLDVNTNTFQALVKSQDGTEEVQIIGNLNRAAGTMNVVAVGAALVCVTLEGFVSSEANNSATQVGFDIQGVDCVVGTAQPIESPINIQQMTDVQNMYRVDATLSHIETMTTVLAQVTDIEGVRFIDTTYDRLPSQQKISEVFDAVAPSNYAHGDTAWREELKAKLDRVVSQLQTQANYYNGHTVVFAHPLDAQLIANVKWIYAATEQVNDVAIDYKVGQYISGTTSYIVLQSPHFTQGKLRTVFVPGDEDHKTLVYYPYAFNTIRGAASSSPNAANVPSIQMIKRHLFKAFTPLVAMVEIKNNGVRR